MFTFNLVGAEEGGHSGSMALNVEGIVVEGIGVKEDGHLEFNHHNLNLEGGGGGRLSWI